MGMLLILLAFAALAKEALGNGYLNFDIERRTSASTSSHLDHRAPAAFNVPISQHYKVEYLINIATGTPGQSLAVTIDTGSSGLWIPSRKFCRSKRCDQGSFDPTTSSTYKLISNSTFNVSYAAPGDWDAGDWVSDTISIGGKGNVSNQIFALANSGADVHGVLGLSLDPAQPFGPPGMQSYPSIMDNFVQDGLINRRAYSLYLNSYNQTYGSVAFGGVDTTKYTGDLIALPLQSGSLRSAPSNFFVTLSKVTFTDAVGAKSVLTPDGYAQMVLIDSGTSYTILTNDLMERLANGMGASRLDDGGGLFVKCAYRNTNATLSYTFGGPDGVTIAVPISETIATGNDECDFAFGPQYGFGLSILGDSFLRSAYGVFDVDNNIVALAQAVQNKASTSNLVIIPTGTSIPGVASTATASGTPIARTEAAQSPTFATARRSGTSIIAVNPTFNLGSMAGSAAPSAATSATASSSAAGRDKTKTLRFVLLYVCFSMLILVF